MKITAENTNLHCRTCLGELSSQIKDISGSKHNISQLQLSDAIMQFLSLENKNDKYSGIICQQCYEKVKFLEEFRATSLRSKRHLETMKLADVVNSRASKLPNVLRATSAPENEIQSNQDWLEFDVDNNALQTTETTDKIETQLLNEAEDELLIHEYKVDVTFEESINNNEVNINEVDVLSGDNIKVEPYMHSPELSHDVQTSDEDFNSKYTTDTDSESSSNFTISKIKTNAATKSSTALRNKSDAKTKKNKPSENRIRCELCPRRFINQENLDAHMRTHRGLKPFQCKQCECSYVQASRLRRHIREKHTENFKRKEEKETICSFEGCGKVFHREASYKAHYRIKHSDSKPEWKTYVCEDCGRVCKNISLLHKHSYTHRPVEEYPYKCEHCNKRFITKCHYKEHLLRHAGIKRFECNFCGMKKTTMAELRIHINYHTKEKQWHCPQCPSVFSNAVNLRRHDRVVHQGIRSYTCRFCNESFGKPDTLKHHEMRHTGERPHVCSVCSKRFIQAIALKTHMKTHLKNMEKAESSTQNIQTQTNAANNNVLQ